jgi:hypothetical protein
MSLLAYTDGSAAGNTSVRHCIVVPSEVSLATEQQVAALLRIIEGF